MYDVPDMARLLNRREMLAATDVSGFVFDRMIKRGGMALTFGVVRAPVRDRYIATDPVVARTVIDLASASRLPQPQMGALVRLNNLVVLDAIVRAETEIEPLGLALIKGANALQLMSGTEIELRRHLFGPPQQQERLRRPELIEQVTTINLAALIAGVRRNAQKAGFDLGAPLFLMPGDPHYAGIRRELQEIRDRETKRLEKAVTAARVALRQRITENVMIISTSASRASAFGQAGT
jgi:hypothetical protein